ncbi:MAG: metallophosphoesterase [Bacteroidetes bacterium]|jgi:predicted MPP superfamily phosphohydrolase|nr:metallophosphoesterase [Bacteroidota bacterium]
MIVVTIFFSILIGLDVYAFQAFRFSDLGQKKAFRKGYMTVSVISLLLLGYVFLQRVEQFESSPSFLSYIRGYLFIVYFSKLIVTLPLLIDDFRRFVLFLIGFFRGASRDNFMPGRSAFLSKMGLVMAGVPAFLLTYGIVRNPFRFQLRTESIPVPNLPRHLEGLKIVQISDLHSGTFNSAAPFKEAIDLVNNQKPDIVVFTGDLVNERAKEADEFISAFSTLKSKYGKYSILGNHDYGDYVRWNSPQSEKENFDLLLKQHEKLGWKLLLDHSEQINIEGFKLNILGVENISALPNFPKYGNLEKAWNSAPKGDYNILLSHDPTHWEMEVIQSYQDINLTLSGHTHGFQFGIEVPGFIKWSPSKWIYKHWAGLYKVKNQYLYVNRGLGCLGYPGRVGILPEVTAIKLTRA